MWRILVLFIAVVVLLVLFAPPALSAQEQQDRQKITVKSKEINNGVVILTAQDDKSAFELRCNKGMSGCAVLDPGEYMMLRLGRNQGLYDCDNAEVYRKSNDSNPGDLLGQYCLAPSK